MNQLAAIHIAKKQLGLDDETYRDVLVRVTGKASSKEMTDGERARVIAEMNRLGASGFTAHRNTSRKRLDGRFAAKLQALWISGWHLGVIRDRSDAALLAFVKRQTGLEHTRFLHYPDDARKAVEALKGWLAREGGVDWSAPPPIIKQQAPWREFDTYKVATALIRKADALGLFTLPLPYETRLAGIAGRHVAAFTSKEWIKVHRHLGERIRAALSRGETS